jgi:signal transduction histidine kinase
MYTASPLIAGESMFGAIIVFQDVSEERRLDYLKSEFISLASHQLRTPLSALRWYIELLSESRTHLSHDNQEYLKQMEASVERMVTLLSALLRAAHVEGDQLEPDMHPTDVVELVKELEKDSETILHDAGLTCTHTLPDHPVVFETDPTLLRIVLQNLISNAVKYSAAHSGKKITIALTETKKELVFTVHDEGMGIPQAEQARVFQKFFRAKNVRKQDTDGNGLGLYITRTIVERLHGTISFISAENKGTTFTITFPLKKTAKGK